MRNLVASAAVVETGNPDGRMPDFASDMAREEFSGESDIPAVLIIDDELETTEEIAFKLTTHGYNCFIAHDATSALQVFEEEARIAIVITMQGRLRAIQRTDRYQNGKNSLYIQSSKLATLGEMATAVAHELNQPLNTIRFASSNLEDAVQLDKLTPKLLKSKLKRIDSQVQRASSIIDHMRIFGRATAIESPGPMNPCLAVSGALDLMGEQLRLANINVISEFPDYELQVMGHPILLEQVVLNLLANARDQVCNNSIDNKEIRLSVREHGDSAVEIEISDSGGGVPEAVIGRIFEPFYTTKKIGEGTGLGLSLSYGIVHDMGGAFGTQR